MAYRPKSKWEGSLKDYLNVGDTVDTEMYEYFLDVVTPETDKETLVQIGEPWSETKDGQFTFETLEKINGVWVYKGTCVSGDNKHVES